MSVDGWPTDLSVAPTTFPVEMIRPLLKPKPPPVNVPIDSGEPFETVIFSPSKSVACVAAGKRALVTFDNSVASVVLVKGETRSWPFAAHTSSTVTRKRITAQTRPLDSSNTHM
jgi:hypothetical protein